MRKANQKRVATTPPPTLAPKVDKKSKRKTLSSKSQVQLPNKFAWMSQSQAIATVTATTAAAATPTTTATIGCWYFTSYFGRQIFGKTLTVLFASLCATFCLPCSVRLHCPRCPCDLCATLVRRSLLNYVKFFGCLPRPSSTSLVAAAAAACRMLPACFVSLFVLCLYDKFVS